MRRTQRGILIGALLGAALGAALAWGVLGNQDDDGNKLQVKASPSDWFQIGLSILATARKITDMVERS